MIKRNRWWQTGYHYGRDKAYSKLCKAYKLAIKLIDKNGYDVWVGTPIYSLQTNDEIIIHVDCGLSELITNRHSNRFLAESWVFERGYIKKLSLRELTNVLAVCIQMIIEELPYTAQGMGFSLIKVKGE